uniref:FPL domain-containing protein n=1 Tax=Globodera pallida TaxID=36090 RepID=A0A183BRV1_GLOPA
MLKKITGNSSSLWKPRNPHSLEYLRYLHGTLMKNDKITEANSALVVEALRAITEVLIWGDQNDGTVFDFFLECQICYKHSTFCLRTSEMKHFLLSNNNVNLIIMHNFDFTNEEIIAYYISFLKTLSFKLNPKTVNFFFNENTNEFPLFTASIRFYSHSESMVRIAVRTVTLNIFKITDDFLEKYVLSNSQKYFDKVCMKVATQIVDMDIFARSAQNEQSNRSRLMTMMDMHLDNIHYLNDILMTDNEHLNTLLIESIYRHIFGPIYLASLTGVRAQPHTILVSRVASLFLVSQFFYVVHVELAVRTLLTSLFFGDQNDISTEWTRTIEGKLQLSSVGKWENLQERIFFHCHMNSLNEGVQNELLLASQLPYCDGFTAKCDPELTESLIRIIENCSLIDTPIRPITIQLCCVIFRRILVSLESDQHLHSTVELAVRRSQHKLQNVLRGALQTEKFFLEMFEDEYWHLQKNELKMKELLEDPALFLPPSNTPLSGVTLTKRMPSGNDEHIRRFFFVLRKFKQDLCGQHEEVLPLSFRVQEVVEINDCINLSNSDLLACTVVDEKNGRLSRFLVTDQFQLILVEPDSRTLGWAIVRFVCKLQDVQVSPTDNRTLHVIVEDVKMRSQRAAKPSFDAKLVFDDHIRCMAAKQRLSRGKKSSRDFKLNLVTELFGMRLPQQQQVEGVSRHSFPCHSATTSVSMEEKRPRGAAPGSVQKLRVLAKNDSSDASIPPDPETARFLSGRIHHA